MPSVAHIIRRRRNRKHRQQVADTRSRIWSAIVFGGTALILLGPIVVILGFTGYLYALAVSTMPEPADTIYLDPIVAATNFYDADETTLLYAVQDPLGDDRAWVNIESLPEHIVSATLQMEDPDFLTTSQFDFWRVTNQLWRYGLGLPLARDRSLAGRLADQTLVPNAGNNGIDPRLLHFSFSAEVQRRYTPRRVVEWYLNTAFYGNDAYGIEAASQVYFGKPATDLTQDESALLAAIPLAPQFNPIDNEQAAEDRQLNLLRAMRTADLITQDEFDAVASIDTPIRTDLAQPPLVAPEFAIYAREQTEAILDSLDLDGARLVSRGGLQVTTTLDLDLYYQTECLLRAHVAQLSGQNADDTLTLTAQPCTATAYLSDVFNVNLTSLPNQGAVVVHDVRTGEIRALVGDATAHAYQPGPAIYPFVYLTGFLSGNYTPARMVLDIPTQFPGPTEGSIYTPINADGQYRGPMNLRDAMASSIRTPAIAVANREGLNSIIETAQYFGVMNLDDIDRYDLAVVDRGANVSVLDMTYSYSGLATLGTLRGVDLPPQSSDDRTRHPVAVRRIADAQGNVLWDYNEEQIAISNTTVIDVNFAYLVTDILSDSGTRRNILDITADVLDIERPVALANGLTGDTTHSWTIGYTPQLVVGVQLSREDDGRMSLDNYGLDGAAPVWQAVSQLAHDRYSYQPASWTPPESITQLNVCSVSGLLPADDNACPTRTEIFHPSVLPAQQDLYWQSVAVNSQTGQRASSSTPDFLVVEQQYFIPPPDALEWWRTNNLPLPPTDYDSASLPEALSGTQIFVPEDFAYVSGIVDIRGSVDTSNMQSYRVRYGAGSRPTEFVDIGEPRTTYTEGVSLGLWDTASLNGPYVVQISVLNTDGTVDSAGVRVTVDNTAPSIELTTGEGNPTLFRWPTETVIPLVADVNDNLEVNRVEFYNNGTLIGEVTDAPFEWIYTIDNTGDEIFTATVFDEAGNQASDEITVEVIRPGG
ncbi:MAG: transglycosylase domain-containing protein [Chloroflexota bacterium]